MEIQKASENETRRTFTEQDRRIFRLQKMMQREARNVLQYVFLLGTSDRDATKPLDNHLISTLGFTSQNLKGRFTRIQRERLLSDYDGSTYDVTLLWICIMLACFLNDMRRSWVPSFLEHLLTEVKNLRNNLAHEEFTGDEGDFVEMVEDLRKLLITILETAGQLYRVDNADTKQRILELNLNMNGIRDDSLVLWDITSYENENLFIQKQKMVLTNGADELRTQYSKWLFLTPITCWFDGMQLKVDSIYTDLRVTTGGLNEHKREVQYADIMVYAETSNTKTSLGNVAQIILIEGIAGSGKSTMAKLMMSEWVNKNSTMKNLLDFDLVLYMECRNSCVKSLSELLSFLMPKTSSRFKDGDLIKCVLNLRLFLIIDGLDELNEASSLLLQEILQQKKTVDITILCTTRPEKVKEFSKMVGDGFQVTYLVIEGIFKEKRVEFVRKYCNEIKRSGRDIQDMDRLTQFLKSLDCLKDHWRLPINLMLVTILWAQSSTSTGKKFTTASKLYLEFARLTKEKLTGRLRGNRNTCHLTLSEMEEKLEKILISLHWEAFSTLRKGQTFLTSEATDRIRDACFSVGLPSEDVMGAFLMQTNSWTADGPLIRLSFSFKGMQDFHAALFILQRLEKNKRVDVTAVVQSFQDIMTLHNISDETRRKITDAVLEIFASTEVPTDPTSCTWSCGEYSTDTNGISSIQPKSNNESRLTEAKSQRNTNSTGLKEAEKMQVQVDKTLVNERDVKRTKSKFYNPLKIFLPDRTVPSFELYVPNETLVKASHNASLTPSSPTLSTSSTISTVHSMLEQEQWERQPAPSPRAGIRKILEDLHKDKKGGFSLHQYQNLLLLLGGLLHTIDGRLTEDMAKELVDLFAQSGVKNNKQWLDLLSEVECDDCVVEAVIQRVPILTSDVIEVNDMTVDAYVALLPHGRPSAVKVKISGKAEENPRLNALLNVLGKKSTPMMLYLLQDFRHTEGSPTSPGLVLRIFRQCHVTKFWGRLDKGTAASLPHTLEGLALLIKDDKHYKDLEATLRNLTKIMPCLDYLWLHMAVGITPEIMNPLPHIRGCLRLYLSHVEDSNMQWAVKACVALKPHSKGFANLRFPRSGLTLMGCKRLLLYLRKARVTVAKVWISSSNVQPEDECCLIKLSIEALDCKFQLTTEDEIWAS